MRLLPCPRLLAALPLSALLLGLTLAAAGPTALADHHEESPAPAPEAAKTPGTLDVLVLTDGRRIEGEIIGQDADLVSIRSAGVLRAYPRARVKSIEQVARPAPMPQPTAETGGGPAPGKTSDAPPKGKRPKKRARTDRAKTDRAPASAELTPAAAAWLEQLIASLGGGAEKPDPAVTRSVVAAIRALGPAAAPRLEQAAAEATGQPAKILGKLAAAARKPAPAKRTDRATGARMGRADQQIVTRLKSELDLDDTQQQAVSGALKQHRKRQKDIARQARDQDPGREVSMQRFAESRATFLADVRAVLNDAQAVALADIVQETLAAGRKKRKKKGAPSVD